MSKLFIKTVVIAILLSMASCQKEKQFKEIDFKTPYQLTKEIEEKLAKDTVPWRYQISAAAYATKGSYRDALVHWDKAMPSRERNYTTKEIDSIKHIYKTQNAKSFILNEAKKHKVVIINEAHHSNLHRFFTKSMLKELYALGYKTLLLEALGNGEHTDSLLNKRKYPIQKTGWYTKEPQFGNLIREALVLGFKVLPYEQTTNVNGKLREIAQAKNIQKIIEENPDDKFLIHCGFDHVLEGKHRSWEKAMAERLKEYTGINPLSIHQVTYSERGSLKYNHPLQKAIDPKESLVLIQKDSNTVMQYKRRDAFTDIVVLHPNTIYENNRPNWLFSKNNQKVNLDLSQVTIDYPIMVLAFKKSEPIAKAVPVDITELLIPDKSCVLALPKGVYTIVVTNGKEAVQTTKKVD